MALTGKLSETPFTALVQLYASSKRAVAVTVSLPGSRGEDGVFYIEDGDVVDAWLGDAVGREAVGRAIRLSEGTFRIEPDIQAAERTIPEPLGQLLRELSTPPPVDAAPTPPEEVADVRGGGRAAWKTALLVGAAAALLTAAGLYFGR
jgi:Domain of unknown function (DUF4388)